jgi:anti-sigma28 factor (negative regulator of flagellin synthesis)
MALFDEIKGKIQSGDYAVSDHAIIEARKDGISENS